MSADAGGVSASNDGADRCACPPGECLGIGKGPDNCAAVADRQRPIAEARYVIMLEAVIRMLIEAPNEASLEHARGIARNLLRPNAELTGRGS